MLDNISGGRVDAAFGRAFLPDEFKAFGIPIDESKDRFVEGVQAIKRLWSEEDVVFEGRFHQFGPVTLLPRPVQQPHPPVFVTTARSARSCAEAGRARPPPAVGAERDGHRGVAEPARDLPCRVGRLRPLPRHRADPFQLPVRGGRGRRGGPWQGPVRRRAQHRRDPRRPSPPGPTPAPTPTRATRNWSRPPRTPTSSRLEQKKLLVGSPEQVGAQLEQIAEWFGDDITISLGCTPVTCPSRTRPHPCG